MPHTLLFETVRLFLIGWLLLGCTIGISWAQSPKTQAPPQSITVVTDDNYPPFIFRDASGQVQGILKDTWALWASHTGIRVDLQAMEWSQAQALMEAGKADVIDTLFKTEAREAKYDFSAPYAKLDVPIFFHESISGIVNIHSLKGFTVGVKDGDACIDVLRSNGVEGIKKYGSYAETVAAAGAGDIRVFCVDQPPAVYLLNQLGMARQFRHSVPLYTGEFHRAVHKGNAAMLQTIEDGFAQITPEEQKEIEEKWYGAEIEGSGIASLGNYALYGAYAALGVLGLAAGLFVWNLSLRAHVAKKTAELTHTIDALNDAKTTTEQSLDQLNATLAAIPDLMFEVGLDGEYFDVHSISDKLLVAPAPNLIGKTIAEVMPEDAAAIALSALQEASKTGTSHGKQIRLSVPEGVKWFELSVALKAVKAGQEPRFIAISRDITGRKQAEEALARKSALLRDTFDNMSEGVSLFDAKLRLAGWNRRFAELLDFPAWLLKEGTPFSDIVRFNAQRGEYGPGDPEDLVRERVQLAINFRPHHFERTRPNGTVLEIRGVLLPGGGFISSYTDITERKQVEIARESLEVQLRESQKMQAIGTLAGGIAHDFNNIIAAILGNTDLARQDARNNPQAMESLEEIHKSATRARALVQQILSFSRRQPTARKPVSLLAVIEDAVRMLRATLPGRVGLKLHVHAHDHSDADVPPVLADHTQIQQVVINLVNNAVHAMRDAQGHIDIRIDTLILDTTMVDAQPALREIHALYPGRTVRLSITDNGQGMGAATMGRIFEPFFTTKPIDQGTGLGLSVVHGIVQTHEGAITVESQPGQGTTFSIYLPAAQAIADATAATESASLATPEPANASVGQRVLYLDDDETLVFLVTRLLKRRGFQVWGYTSQSDALKAIQAKPMAFDLVVTDYNMPGKSGLEVAREVRAIRADLPVAVASGFIDEALQMQASEAGVRELILKAGAGEEFCAAFVRLAQTVGDSAAAR